MIIKAFSAIVGAAKFWNEKQNETVQELRNKREALQLVMEAVICTKAYLYDLEQEKDTSRPEEKELSEKWLYGKPLEQ